VRARALVAWTILAGVGAPATGHGNDPQSLVSLAERTEDGKLVPYPTSSVVDVDVNSAIRLELSKVALAAYSGASALDPEERGRVVAELKKLVALQKELNEAGRAVTAVAQVRADVTAKGLSLAGASLESYKAALRKLEAANAKLRAYAGDDRYETAVGDAARAGGDAHVALLLYVASEQRRLQARVQQDLEDAPARFLTIAADLGTPPRQLHVPGYDDLKPGAATIVDKTRFTFDEEFAEEYATAQVLAREAADWDRLREAALAAVRGKLGGIQKALGAASADAEALAKSAASDVTPEVKAILADLQKAAADLKEAYDGAAGSLTRALNPPQGSDPAQLLADVVGALSRAAPRVQRATQTLLDLIPRIQATAAGLAASATRVADQLSELMAGPFASALVAARPAMAAPAGSSIRVRLAAARDTEVSLLTADRQDGDVVRITTRVFDTGPAGDVPVPGGETTTYLRVRARGLVADTGAVVLFARPLKHDPGPFIPSAGAYAVFRFKGYRDAYEASSSFWYYTAPGLGVAAIAIPRSSDGATQIAWMGTFHLFGDILQASLGATTDAAPVWGIGLGLHRIAGLGKYIQ
jgi:hypothetical protein